MSLPTKITVIGAGSASFGENTLAALMRSKRLKGSQLALVDRNPVALDIVRRLAERLNEDWDSQISISAHASHQAALEGTSFVVNAIEVGPREGLWKSDFEIPLKYGVRQPYAENGGPGGFAHAARNVNPILEIVQDMEAACPEAWFINYTNPMVRICDLVARYSRIKVVGLCHQLMIGYCLVGMTVGEELGFEIPEGITGTYPDILQTPLRERVVEQALARLDIRAAGTNHFSWILDIHDRESGDDLYPLFRKCWDDMDPDFEPLTRRVFEAFGLFPVAGDSHLCEYLPWVSNPETKPWEKYHLPLYDWDMWAGLRDFSLDRLNDIASGQMTLEGLTDTDSEGALEIIENIAGAGSHYHPAANLVNAGQISNLPKGAIVETPVMVDGTGVNPVLMGGLPEPIAELCRRELSTAQLGIDAAVEGSREKALQCLLLDPVITDIEQAKLILEDYLETYREQLPQFWR